MKLLNWIERLVVVVLSMFVVLWIEFVFLIFLVLMLSRCRCGVLCLVMICV